MAEDKESSQSLQHQDINADRDAATIVGFATQSLGLPLSIEKDSEFDRVVLVSQFANVPLQIVVLSFQGEMSYTVMDLLNAGAETYYRLREALDAIEEIRTRFE